MDGASYALICTAAADIAGHGFVDILVRGLWILAEKNGGAHDLPRLTVAALRDVDFDPGTLYGMRIIGGEAFDGGHMPVRDTRKRRYARTNGDAIEVDRTGAAERHAAAEFCAGKSKRIADDPKERSGRIIFDGN